MNTPRLTPTAIRRRQRAEAKARLARHMADYDAQAARQDAHNARLAALPTPAEQVEEQHLARLERLMRTPPAPRHRAERAHHTAGTR